MVARNSELLAGFAGGNIEGSERVVAGKEMFQRWINRNVCTNLGYSVEEATRI